MGVYLRGESWYIDFYEEGKRYTERVGQVSKSVAEEKLAVKRSEVIPGEWKPKVTRILFDKFKEQYLEFSQANKKPRTAKRDVVSLGSLQRFLQKRKEDGVSVRTINIELACLRHMFNMAMKWGKAQRNPLKEVKLFKEPEGKDRILSPEEEIKLLQSVRTSKKAKHLEPVIIRALATGMRKGEVLGLKWLNVDFANRLIVIEGTKSGYIRKIPMNAKLTETLTHVRRKNQSEYVFADRKGNPFKSFRSAWEHVLEKAGIENLTFHSLRHTFGTRLGMAGVDVKTIQELMGHRDIKMTMRYSHPTPQHKRNAVELLDGVTSIFTTEGVDSANKKVVNIGNH